MASPADRQVAANEAVERMAQGLYKIDRELQTKKIGGRIMYASWDFVASTIKERYRQMVSIAIQQDLIRPGAPPETGPEPMPNQLTIDD